MTNQPTLHPQPTDPSAPHIATVSYGTGFSLSPNMPASAASTPNEAQAVNEAPTTTIVQPEATPSVSDTDAPATIGSAIKTMIKTKSGSKDVFETIAVASTFNELVRRRKAWEEGSYAQSNNELYALLADCLDIYISMRSSFSLCKELNKLLDERGIGYNASTTLPLKIVRIAFIEPGMENKVANRAYGYARVIKAAADKGITGKDLAKFIVDHNGIDEIRRTDARGRTKADVQQQYEADAETALAEAPPIAKLEMREDLKPADGEAFSVALVRVNSDNTASIVFALNNVAMVKAMLRHAGKHFSEQHKHRDEEAVHQQRRQIEAQNRQSANTDTTSG